MFRPAPISFLQFGLFWCVVAVGAAAIISIALRSRGRSDGPETRGGKSTLGIALQALAFFVVGFGSLHFALPWSAPSSLICSVLVLLLGGSGVAIFIASTRAMGKNWSVVARTRSDHQLVRSGPFALVRHPIYLALFLYFLSFGVAFGHFAQMLAGVPLYVAGAAIIRIRIEEALLRAQFGDEHAHYVRDVPAFIPFLR